MHLKIELNSKIFNQNGVSFVDKVHDLVPVPVRQMFLVYGHQMRFY
jgi:hypothetical protein